jgi:hypothetical protein
VNPKHRRLLRTLGIFQIFFGPACLALGVWALTLDTRYSVTMGVLLFAIGIAALAVGVVYLIQTSKS